MAFYNLSTIISKFLKKITLTQEEKDEICDEIGAVSNNATSYGGQGDEDADHLVMFGPEGDLTVSHFISLKRNDVSLDEAFFFWEDDKFKMGNIQPGIGGGATIIFQDPAAGYFEYRMPNYACTLTGVNDATGYIPVGEIPHIITTLDVANNTEMLALTLEQARNKIIVNNDNYLYGQMFVLKEGETNPADINNWQSLGDMLRGGSAACVEGTVPVHGVLGGLNAKTSFVIYDAENPSTYSISFFSDSYDDIMRMSFVQGLNVGTLSCPVLDADYTWTLPLASGTFALDTNVVTMTGDQAIGGLKVFNENVGMLGNLGVNGDVIIDGNLTVLGSSTGTLTSVLTADEAAVVSSITPVSSAASLALDVGNYLIKLYAYCTQDYTGGSRIKLDFDGTITPNGGFVQIGTNGSATVSNAIISTDEGVFGDLTRDSTTDAHYITEVYYNVTVAGTLTLQFAQAVSNATGTVLKAGSRLIAERLT